MFYVTNNNGVTIFFNIWRFARLHFVSITFDYIGEWYHSIIGCKLCQYANDTVLLSHHTEYEKAIYFQNETKHLVDWFELNALEIAPIPAFVVMFVMSL